MSDNINTMTPGSAVADQLQDILARKRLVDRQQMLDALNQQNIQSQMDYRTQQAESLREQHEANADWRKAQAAEKTENVTRHKQFRENFDKWIGGPDFTKLPADQQQAYRIAGMSPDDDLVKTLLSNYTKQQSNDEWFPIYNENGPTGDWAPKGSHFIPRAPREPQEHPTYVGTDPTDGQPIIMSNKLGPGGIPQFIKADGSPYYGKLGPKPSNANQKPAPMYDKVAWTNFYKATRKNKAGALSHAINSITDRNLRADITTIANGKDENGNPLLEHPVDNLMLSITAPEGLDPEAAKAYLQNVADILREAKGGQQ